MTEPNPKAPGDNDADYEPARPLWTVFLIPLAIVIGAAMISGTIWFVDRDDDDGAAAAPANVDGGVSQAPGDPVDAPGSQPADLRETLVGYAGQVGADETAFSACLLEQDNVAAINADLQAGNALGVNGTPTFFVNNKKIVGNQPAAIFEEVIEAELAGGRTSVDEYSAAVRALAEAGRFAIIETPPDVSAAPIEGERDATVMIAEFSDFECPFCRRWNNEVLPGLRDDLGEDVALAFLHFPIVQIHPNAGNASVAAICAAEQGKFWEMHDLLFARQDEWKGLRVQ